MNKCYQVEDTKQEKTLEKHCKIKQMSRFKSLASNLRKVIYCSYQEKQSQTFYIYLPLY